MTLTFDLMTPQIDPFMPRPRRLLVPIFIEIGWFVFNILCSQINSIMTIASEFWIRLLGKLTRFELLLHNEVTNAVDYTNWYELI